MYFTSKSKRSVFRLIENYDFDGLKKFLNEQKNKSVEGHESPDTATDTANGNTADSKMSMTEI